MFDLIEFFTIFVDGIQNVISYLGEYIQSFFSFLPKLISILGNIPTLFFMFPPAIMFFYNILLSLCGLFLVVRIKQMLTA